MAAPLPWSDGSGARVELPTLASDASPLDLGDWLELCGSSLRDLSAVSARWWNLTLREAQCYFDRWKTASPLERVQLNPQLPDELFDIRYQRTEQRGVNLLLKAIPVDQQQALITARELTSTALLFRLLVRYQPGGAGEKAILLARLMALDKATSVAEWAAALRSWRRHFSRAQEIGAILPDGTLLLKALEPAVTQIASMDAQAAFRLAQSRLQLGVDQQPHHGGVWRFSQCLLAEVETLSLMSSTPSPTTPPVKVKQLEAQPKGQGNTSSNTDKGKGTSTTALPCRYFRSDTGCKAGKQCKWSHAWDGIEDKAQRLKQNSKVLLSAPTEDDKDQSWIVPLGGIAELGYRFEWRGSHCLLKDEYGHKLDVMVQHGCPMVNKELGQAMIDRLEKRQVHLAQKALLVKTLFTQPHLASMAPPMSTEVALTLKLKHLFQDVPDEILMRVIPDMSELEKVTDGSLLPWNRRKRRRLAQAKQIVLHLFSGPDNKYWEKTLQQNGVEVLCVDLQAAVAADLHDDNVYRFLLALAASGRVKAIVGGPPCRTVSALRYQEDGGPGVLRNEAYPYGLPSLSMADQALVHGDSILLFRMLALYVLCEDARHEQEPQTALAVEQPEDPARYRPQEEVQRKQFMSIWRTKAWQTFAKCYQIKMLHFDQGPMGHVKRKPTTLAVKLRDIHALNEVRGPPSGGGKDDRGQDRNALPLRERCELSKQWAEWAPGLKVALVLALQDHLHRGCTPSVEAALRPLGQVALEGWRQHYLQDHMPARRDCRHCVRASARSKPHRRITHPEAYTLSVDLSGKMVVGQDQSRHDCRYMMVAVYTFPVDGAGRSLVEAVEASAEPMSPAMDLEEYTPTEPGGDDPGAEFMPEEEDGNPGEDQAVVGEAALQSGQTAYDAWQKEVQSAQDVAVKNLTFVEVLQGRAVHHILPALARIYARLRSLGLPLYRLHCDRARELISAPVKRWTLDRGVVTTLTSGDSYKSNGRVEGELGVIKKHVRTIVASTGVGLDCWPLAAIHIGERRLRGQLRSMGIPVGPLLQFGAKAYALKKSWQDRYQPWREIRDEVTVLGPALQSSMTSTSYYVQSTETQRYFYTDDVVVPSAEQPEADDVRAYLPVLPDPSGPAAWDGDVPRRRLREKTAIPQLSRLSLEGEICRRVQKWLCDHRELFDVHAPNDADLCRLEWSSDSWTLETPSRTSSSAGAEEPQGKEAHGFPGEDWQGGGDEEEAPNSWDGGSRPAASLNKLMPGGAPCTRIQLLRATQEHLADYVNEEMGHVDITNLEQGWYMGVLRQAIMHKVEVEEQLLQYKQEQENIDQKELEEEFLVTRTMSTKEVMEDFENWVPAIKAEYTQLVHTKEAVIQITKKDLQARAEKEGKVIEVLPAKMVFTRKAGVGARRARAVCCGNYSDTRFSSDCYAGGADGCQVRALVRTAALRSWTIAATDIRVAFLNAPRREDGKLVANVYKRLGLAREGEVWLVRLAMYGLTTSPRDWSQYRDRTLPVISWVREREGRNVRGHFIKTADENLWRLEEVDTVSDEVCWTGLMSVYVDDILVSGEEAAVSAALTTLQATWTTSSIEWASAQEPVHFCGFEIRSDESGDGFHLSQQKYEQEILARCSPTSRSRRRISKRREMGTFTRSVKLRHWQVRSYGSLRGRVPTFRLGSLP
eukprot:g14985.t1